MCVKLIKNGIGVAYDQNKPLRKQLVGCSQIMFDCVQNDDELLHFLKEMLSVAGDIDYRVISKALSAHYESAENKLEEISTICAGRE